MSGGRVFWVTGLAGAGKTTLGGALYRRLLDAGCRAILLDGDRLREVFGGQHGYSVEERRYLAMCYARLCSMLADQGADVVCATVSMFASVRQWNREHIPGYREIYVVAPVDHLLERRAFYSDPAISQDVVGLNPAYELPTDPHLLIENDGRRTPEQIAEEILSSLGDHRPRQSEEEQSS
ncbi:adenylyl-sulfate kinase [Chitiniphilus shinanonensis]|uniref:Adenylyl-sulfate kinase n=1 Tax=Chitiniphilus shinanonensis TaxID=553088 RepID=A0ABQ6BNB1_9NEIS|nr:adenylyl-sulfate kinase [Chitiniphilus shinanonensis]GLS03413.1 adenylyl-sulfate kinase [Chitiniphilus shinanonensis]